MDFENSEAFEAWLKQQPYEVYVGIATRAALRALPEVFRIDLPGVFRENLGRTDDNLDLKACRAILTAGVAGKWPTPKIKEAARAAFLAATSAAGELDGAGVEPPSIPAAVAVESTLAAAEAAGSAAQASTNSAAFSVASAATAAEYSNRDHARSAASAVRSATYSDCDLSEPFDTPLWHGTPARPDLAAGWEAFSNGWADLQKLAKTNPEWRWWTRWYQGFLEGEPLDWELQRRVALIPDEQWEKGPERIAELIVERTASLMDVRITDLEAELSRLANLPVYQGNRDNGGPPLDDLKERLQFIQLIKAQLDILNAERAKLEPNSDKEPDSNRILSAALALLELAKKFGQWVAYGVAGTVVIGGTNQVREDAFEHFKVSDRVIELIESVGETAGILGGILRSDPPARGAHPPVRDPIDL